MTTSRTYTFGGAAHIPFSEISSYASRYGIKGEEFEDFLYFIGELDDEYVSWQAEEDEKNKDEGERKKAAEDRKKAVEAWNRRDRGLKW